MLDIAEEKKSLIGYLSSFEEACKIIIHVKLGKKKIRERANKLRKFTWIDHFLSRNSHDSLLLTEAGTGSFTWRTKPGTAGPMVLDSPHPSHSRASVPAVLSTGSRFASSPSHRLHLILQDTDQVSPLPWGPLHPSHTCPLLIPWRPPANHGFSRPDWSIQTLAVASVSLSVK